MGKHKKLTPKMKKDLDEIEDMMKNLGNIGSNMEKFTSGS